MLNPLQLYQTTTTVSTDEIAMVLDKGQKLLADLAIDSGLARAYGLEDGGKCVKKQLYLYLYAINSWNTTPLALNYFDQTYLIKMMSRVEQLFYIATYKPAC